MIYKRADLRLETQDKQALLVRRSWSGSSLEHGAKALGGPQRALKLISSLMANKRGEARINVCDVLMKQPFHITPQAVLEVALHLMKTLIENMPIPSPAKLTEGLYELLRILRILLHNHLGDFPSAESITMLFERTLEIGKQLSLTNGPGYFKTQGRIRITVRLGESIGVTVDANGYVTDVTPGGQVEQIGSINVGDRVVQVGGTTLGGIRSLVVDDVARDQPQSIQKGLEILIKENTKRGDTFLDLTFEPKVTPPHLLSDDWCS